VELYKHPAHKKRPFQEIDGNPIRFHRPHDNGLHRGWYQGKHKGWNQGKKEDR
jgi:hypothetical protein